jgi:hypothetical protein
MDFLIHIKTFNRRPTALLLLMLLLVLATRTMPAMADDIRPQVASLISSPGRCVLKTGRNVCQMKLNLMWETPIQDAYCIMQKNVLAPVKCWENAWRGKVEIDFIGANKTYFLLKQSSFDKVLVETAIAVTVTYKQRKRAQRRKRNFWRIF